LQDNRAHHFHVLNLDRQNLCVFHAIAHPPSRCRCVIDREDNVEAGVDARVEGKQAWHQIEDVGELDHPAALRRIWLEPERCLVDCGILSRIASHLAGAS